MRMNEVALQTAPDSSFIVDIRDKVITYVNEAAVKLLKANSSTEVVGKAAIKVLPVLVNHLQVVPITAPSLLSSSTTSTTSNGHMYSRPTPPPTPSRWSGRTEVICLDGESFSVDMTLSKIGPIDDLDGGSYRNLFLDVFTVFFFRR
jgi:PAS domain-containing protein